MYGKLSVIRGGHNDLNIIVGRLVHTIIEPENIKSLLCEALQFHYAREV